MIQTDCRRVNRLFLWQETPQTCSFREMARLLYFCRANVTSIWEPAQTLEPNVGLSMTIQDSGKFKALTKKMIDKYNSCDIIRHKAKHTLHIVILGYEKEAYHGKGLCRSIRADRSYPAC